MSWQDAFSVHPGLANTVGSPDICPLAPGINLPGGWDLNSQDRSLWGQNSRNALCTLSFPDRPLSLEKDQQLPLWKQVPKVRVPLPTPTPAPQRWNKDSTLAAVTAASLPSAPGPPLRSRAWHKPALFSTALLLSRQVLVIPSINPELGKRRNLFAILKEFYRL